MGAPHVLAFDTADCGPGQWLLLLAAFLACMTLVALITYLVNEIHHDRLRRQESDQLYGSTRRSDP